MAFTAEPEHRGALRLAGYDWQAVEADLDQEGVAVLPGLLPADECKALALLYETGGEGTFRSKVVMARHGFGRGEYKYFDYPLPDLLQQLRTALYARLVATANRWNASLGLEPRYPAAHAEYLARCHAAGQDRATPLLLRYGPGDYNCLHQDLYGENVFPLQAVILLSPPGEAFDGGELVLTEQRPRMQSRPLVVPLREGDAAVLAVSHRPVQGARGSYRVNMRHGVSRIRRGTRSTAGLIFHDAA
ncbi:MAG: Proline hydroxylase [Ramlibacter sp.]|nr:Proline hydroxylase [Ramlibacter sp.]